jgi:alpha-methylacyl-CoA racemase
MGMLDGYRFVEASGHGPVPFCGMVLQDMGAHITRIAAPNAFPVLAAGDVMNQRKAMLPLDLKSEAGRERFFEEIDEADGLLEGFRPGVMERLGLGPEECHRRNPRLVYSRMTGYGQTGPLARRAGHDINFIALSGVLHAIGQKDGPPVPPLNLAGDFGGGAMFLATGILGALLERDRTGAGKVLDISMSECAAVLMTSLYGRYLHDPDQNIRGANIVDGGAPFYTTYETADGRYVAVGALEDGFFKILADRIGLPEDLRTDRMDKARWPALRSAMAEIFRARPRDEWVALFADSDACLSPVLDLDEAPRHDHATARQAFRKEGSGSTPRGIFIERSGVL